MTNTQTSEVVFRGPHGEALIRKTPGVCGGDACIGNWRIMVWLLVVMRNNGRIDADLLEIYPGLTSQDLAAAWEYNRQHPEEIAEAIRANEEDDD